MDVFSVTFFGHRNFCDHFQCGKKLEKILRELLAGWEYVEFLVGRNGEFDQFVSSAILRAKREYCDSNSALVLVLPYATAEYTNNQESFEKYYDEIEICDESSISHFKSAMQIRNREMVDRADLVICYIERNSGGAFQAVRYAEKQGKSVINLATYD